MSKAEQALEAAHEKAEEIRRRRSAREVELYEEVRALQDRHRAIVEAEFGEAMRAANVALNEARHAVDAGRASKAEAQGYRGLPVGTKLAQWTSGRFGSGNYRLAGASGVLQVYKAGDPYPANTSRPKPGTFIVRHLKKDGSLSIRLDESSNWWGMFNNGPWLPEGMTPEEAIAKAKREAARAPSN